MTWFNKERCKFDTIIRIKDIYAFNFEENKKCIIDITDYKIKDKEISYLQNFSNNDNIFVVDTNWFGGTWSLNDFISAEFELGKEVKLINDKKLSQFEKFVLAYHFACNREYKFAPKGSDFQISRSYVDVLNKGYCVCVGFATILKRLCDKLEIECAVQGCLAKNKFGKVVNHASNLVYLNDKKYNIDGFYYSDPRMDCLYFADIEENSIEWKFNSFLIPINQIDKILIKVWDDDTIIEMNDFKSLYYSKELSISDKNYLSKFFSNSTINCLIKNKNSKFIDNSILFSALKQIGLSEKMIEKTKSSFYERQHLFTRNSDNIL